LTHFPTVDGGEKLLLNITESDFDRFGWVL